MVDLNQKIAVLKTVQTETAAEQYAESLIVEEVDQMEGMIGPIAGAVGVLIAIIDMIIACCYCCRKKKSDAQTLHEPELDEEMTPAEQLKSQ
jgi:hypothetical protein